MTNRTNSWTRAATVVAKLIEIAYEIAAIALLVGIALVLADKGMLVVEPGKEVSVTLWGMSIAPSNMELHAQNGEVDIAGLVICMLYGSAIAGMFAMGFRNIHKVLSISQEESPFTWGNVRLLRRSGFFFLGTIAVEAVFAFFILILLVFVPNIHIHMGMEMDGVIIGILVLCLSQIFAQGVHMQEDIDGLV